jgi:hypothetical protein
MGRHTSVDIDLKLDYLINLIGFISFQFHIIFLISKKNSLLYIFVRFLVYFMSSVMVFLEYL